ncbi:MAG: LD-carboxypeptidase [Gammaproteobacteria bacterium]|nr:LD-carboxypeptidase [Gammaproteobacteria bacterium]
MTSRDSAPPPLRPRALRPGSRVALVAPAGPLQPGVLDKALERCRKLDLEPIVYPAATRRRGYLAGSDDERLADLQAAFDDPANDAVWALRGGYGTLRILDGLDLARQRRAPIPFIGFSDNTNLHALHARAGVISFHGPHPGADFPLETEASFRAALFSGEASGRLPSRPDDPAPHRLVGGSARGRLIGGNLAILASLCGSRDAILARGRILFLEDVGEPAYRVDRMLHQLLRAGAFDGVAGLAFGRFTGVREGAGHMAAVLAELAVRLGVPAVAGLPFGHTDHNCTIPVLANARLDADSATLTVTESATRTGRA